MGVFRYVDNYSAPTKEQRERYMTGRSEEHHFGSEGQILLIEYREAAYLKDETLCRASSVSISEFRASDTVKEYRIVNYLGGAGL